MFLSRHPLANFACGTTSQQYIDNFLAQFREEEGLLVFRANQRGFPVEVAPLERDRALQLYCFYSLWVQGFIMAVIMLAGIGAFLAYRVLPVAIVPIGLVAAASVIGLSIAAEHEARRRATAAFRDRLPIGLAQGWLAGKVMITEKYDWGTVMIWWLILPLLLGMAFPMGTALVEETMAAPIQPLGLIVVRLLAGSSALAVVGFTLLKVALGIRTRHRARVAHRYDDLLHDVAILRGEDDEGIFEQGP